MLAQRDLGGHPIKLPTNVAEVVNVLAARLNCEQHFNVVDSSHTLGTMERVNRDFRMVLQSVTSEWQLDVDDWNYVLPAVQHALNATPLEALGGLSPLEVFTGRRPTQPSDMVLRPAHVSGSSSSADRLVAVPVDSARVLELTTELQQSLENMHASTVTPAQRSAIKRDDVYQVPVNWSVGDFVMYSKPLTGPTNKAKGVWKGPYRVIAELGDRVYEIQDLVQPDVTKPVHAMRLAFYADSAMEVTQELLTVFQHNGTGFVVEKINTLRETDGVLMVGVKWKGLESEENTWETLRSMYEDVPVMINSFLRTKKTALFRHAQKVVKSMRKQRA